MKINKLLFALTGLLVSTSLYATTPKALYIIVDGVPADVVERLQPPTICEIAANGSYGRAMTGGEPGAYTETPTISAIGYTNILTATWMNKHNVNGNSNLSPNYNYWTLFRTAAEQSHKVTTGLFSSWTDNRTVLIGQGKPETGGFNIDYVVDGFDLDTLGFPHKPLDMHVFDYDERVAREAAQCIRRDAPDLSWVYLWYTDDAGHFKGNGEYLDEYVIKADRQVGMIWEAVKERIRNNDEDWMVVVTTDHGRDNSGHNHGGQTSRERTSWISTNAKVNSHFTDGSLAIIDIAPSLCRHLSITPPTHVLWEQDGIPFIGHTEISLLTARTYGDGVELSWQTLTDTPVTIYVSATNEFNTGGTDEYTEVCVVPSGKNYCILSADNLPDSKFLKFVAVSPNTHLNAWLTR